MEKIRKMFTSKSSRNGTYSVGLAVIVIAIAIVINLVAGQLPEKVRNIDISSNNLYDISSICKSIKEIPGFAAGTFDRDAEFRALVSK